MTGFEASNYIYAGTESMRKELGVTEDKFFALFFKFAFRSIADKKITVKQFAEQSYRLLTWLDYDDSEALEVYMRALDWLESEFPEIIAILKELRS